MKCRKCRKVIPDESAFCNLCGAKQVVKEKKPAKRTRPNGTGTAYKRGKTWTAVAIVGWKTIEKNGKPRRVPIKRTKGGFLSKTDALNYMPDLRNQKTAKGIVTLDSIYQAWSTSSLLKLSKSKQTAYKIAYSKLTEIAFTEISFLTIEDLQRQVNDKASTFYPARDMKSLLSHLYKRAVAQQDVGTNLAAFIELPQLDEGENHPFGEQEIKTLWKDYIDGHDFTGYLLLMVYSGMMPGELMIAKKDMIDWDHQTIFGCGLKTKKRKTTPLVIADIILPVLQKLCDISSGDNILCVGRDDFYDQFKETMSRCKFSTPHTPYDCRHSTATALALKDIAPSVIKEVMRHSKFSTTEHYIHVDASPMLDAVNRLHSEPKITS